MDVVRFSLDVEDGAVDSRTMIQGGVYDQCGRESESHHVCYAVRCREVYRRIFGVCSLVKGDLRSEDVEDIVCISKPISSLDDTDRKVGSMPHL